MISKIQLDKPNRMIRFGLGLNNGRWFARLDLWAVGFRLTRKQ